MPAWRGKRITRESALAAIAQFDTDGPDETLAEHGFGPARDYVVVYDGKEYPSKALFGIAYGIEYPDEIPIRERGLQGGGLVLRRLRELGFEIRSLKSSALGLQEHLRSVLSDYLRARREDPFGSGSAVWQSFELLNRAFNESAPVLARDTVAASWSAGAGNWARVPWVAFLDARETTTTQTGVYPVLLFRQDMSGAFLTLAQGVTEPKKRGRAEAIAFLQGVAVRVREQSPDLAESGFALDSAIDLHADPGLGKDYEISTIAHKFYPSDGLPDDDQIVSDLEAVLGAYDAYIENRAPRAGELEKLAREFREQRPYPTDKDKIQVAAREELEAALSHENLAAVEADPSRYEDLKINRFASGAYGGPGPQSGIHRGVIDGGAEAQIRLARALRHLLYDGDLDDATRIDDVVTSPDWRVFGLGESLAVKALAVAFPNRWLPVFPYGGDMGKKRLMQSPPLGIAPLDEAEFDTPGKRAVEANRRLREVLEPIFPEDAWAQGQFLYWLRDRESTARSPQLGLQALADELLLDEAWLEETVELLRDKRQLIFYGPPGTGKTYVARKLAEYIAQDAARVEIVQFHPSYAYEDFIEGYRPTLETGEAGQVQFELRPGPLRRFADNATESEADWCLVIDEINRGNIAKIFGELYYLLEYRGEAIRLQYGGEFQLPTNLYFIGTMNTADRSIALLDAALRRRFHFAGFFPDQPPVQGLLRRWLEAKRPGMEYVADLVDRANSLLPDRHLQIGPSHFMTSRLDDAWLQKIWRGSVMPYLEEQFFDEPQRVEEFALDRLLPGNSAAVSTNDADGTDIPEDYPSPRVANDGS